MRPVARGRLRWVMLVLGAALVAAPGLAQNEEDLAAPPMGPEDPGRLVYVPLWVGPLGDGSRRNGDRRIGSADAWWASVPLGARDQAPERASATSEAKGRGDTRISLREFRLSAPSRSPGEPREFTAIVRVQPFRAGARPSLAVIDPQTALEFPAQGRLLRRSGDAADYVFVVREPVPPALPMANPILRRQSERTEVSDRFDLRLSLNPPPAQASRADTIRR